MDLSDEWKNFTKKAEIKPALDIRDITDDPLDQRKTVIDRWQKDHLNCTKPSNSGHNWPKHHWDDEIRMWIWRKCGKCGATRLNQTAGNEIWIHKDGAVEALIMNRDELVIGDKSLAFDSFEAVKTIVLYAAAHLNRKT